MSFSKEWIILISLVAIISSVLSAMISKTAFKKTFKMVVAIVLIYIFVSPINKSFTDTLKNFNFDFSSNEQYSEQFESNNAYSVETAFKIAIEKTVSEYLKEQKIEYEKMEVICAWVDENPSLSKIIIYCEDTLPSFSKLSENLKSLIGMEFEIEIVST